MALVATSALIADASATASQAEAVFDLIISSAGLLAEQESALHGVVTILRVAISALGKIETGLSARGD